MIVPTREKTNSACLVRVCVIESDEHAAVVSSSNLLIEDQCFGMADVQKP